MGAGKIRGTKSKRWTPNDLRELIQMATNGVELDEIANRLQRTKIGCRYKLSTLGFKCKTVWIRKSYD